MNHKNIGCRALAIHCDVTKDADVNDLAEQTVSTMGKVDILMNNAGVMLHGALETLSTADWEWILGINVLGVVRGVRSFLPHMLKRGSGYIINTSSFGGLGGIGVGVGSAIAYFTSKFADNGFSEALYSALRSKGGEKVLG